MRGLSPEIKAFILANYVGTGHIKMAEMVNKKFGTNVTKNQVKSFYGNKHINSGVTGRFEKGQLAYNKGMKQTDYMSAESIEKTKATRFHKGNLPYNTKPIGYERITKDGYIEVKVKMRPSHPSCNDNFIFKHRLVWEKQNGPIPKGMKLRFLDGNKLNCNIENLALVSNAEHLEITRQNLAFKDPQMSKIGIQISKLQCAISKKEKEKTND